MKTMIAAPTLSPPATAVSAPLVVRHFPWRKIVIAAAALAVAGAVSAYVVHRRARTPSTNTLYETARVDEGKIVARVTATGTVSALVTVQVGAQVSGRIAKLHVDFNSPVKKGDVIAEIDPQLFTAAVAQAHANVNAAEGNLAKARAQLRDNELKYQRQVRLLARGFIPQQDLDTALAARDVSHGDIAAAQGALEQARAALDQTKINLAYTRIVSPTDGVVISRNVDVGQTVAAAFAAPTLFVIAEDLRKMQVDTSVAEADVGRLRAGMAATFTVDAYSGEVFYGTVRQVRNAPQTTQNVVTYDAVIDVNNLDMRLKPGMTANAVFVFAEKDGVVRVPNAALRFRAPPEWTPTQAKSVAAKKPALPTGDRTVWALRAGKPVPIVIHTGITDGALTELTGGALASGEVLITDAPAAGNAMSGMRVF